MFIPSTFKRPVSSWKALNLRKTLLMASRSEERFSRNAETDLVCRLLLEKKKKHVRQFGRTKYFLVENFNDVEIKSFLIRTNEYNVYIAIIFCPSISLQLVMN